MKGSRIASLVGAGAFVLGTVVLGSTALAQVPDDGEETTTGTVNGGATNASVFNIGDLKTDTMGGALDASDYDDDPGGDHPGPNFFHVAPNLGDDPLQWANKYIFINNPSGVEAVQKTIRAIIPGGGEGGGEATSRVVYHDQLENGAVLTREACVELLGSATTGPSVAHGLITTGQKSSSEIQSIINGCLQGHVGVAVNPFPISKHLPPGWYEQCVVLGTSGGGATEPFCVPFHIEPVTGFAEDVEEIDYGTLIRNVESIDPGDFDILTTDMGTVMGLGNTSPVLEVAFSHMENDVDTPDEGDDKFITAWFDVQINRADSNGNIIDWQRLDMLEGGDDPDAADPFAGATIAVLNEICLEPNEPLKLDFSVMPRDILFPGDYNGLVRLVLSEENACIPTLAGEDAEGDLDDDPFNNLPGDPVMQDLPNGAPEP
jgi:hypothetical protein